MSALRTIVLLGVVIGCLFVLATAASGGAVAAGINDHDGNETLPHEHPDEAADDGDLEAIRGWLGGQMREVHVDCAEGMAENAFDACDRLDDDYPEFLEQYVEVERETEDDEGTSETFEETRDDQRELAELTEEFWNTYEEYQEARQAGDEERARELARELRGLADRIEALGGNLDVRFAELENRTGFEYEEARNATRNTTEEVVRVTIEVEEVTFTPTELSVSAEREWAQFTEPATFSGRLVDENGTQIDGGRIVVRVDNETAATTRTGDDGRYEVDYRPVTTPTGETNVTVAYVPEGAEPYLGSDASTSIDVRSVTPDFSLSETPESAALGDEIVVDGRVSAGIIGATNVPVELRIDGERLATTRTNTDGTFTLITSLPADVPDGDRTLAVRASRPGLAIAPTETETPIRVDETPTELSVAASEVDDGVRVQGELTTEDGEQLAGQEVSIRLSDEERTTATTDAEGRYRATVDAETGTSGGLTVEAVYDDPGSNLGSSRAETVLGGSSTVADNSILFTAIGIGAFAVLALAGWLLYRRWYRRTASDLQDGESTGVGGTDSADGSDETTDSVRPELTLAPAWDRLQAGSPAAAVRASYAAIRARLSDGTPADSRTHWEFYRDVGNSLPEDRASALRTVTETYERAAFAAKGVDDASAEEALDAAERCLDEQVTTDGGVDPDGDRDR